MIVGFDLMSLVFTRMDVVVGAFVFGGQNRQVLCSLSLPLVQLCVIVAAQVCTGGRAAGSDLR